MKTAKYDPFIRGPFPVGVRTIPGTDHARDRVFPCEIWYPADAQHAGQDLAPDTQDSFAIPASGQPRRQMAVRDAAARDGLYPLIAYSHASGPGARRMATFLCNHLSSHGYVVAALDHSEVVAPELASKAGETPEQKKARVQAWIANRVPDIRFLLDHLLQRAELNLNPVEIGLVGHSFGGWTVLAATAEDPRVRAVVALAPAGNSQPRPGIIPAKLTFSWGRDVPTLYLAAENDTPIPLAGMYELFERTPARKKMVILRRSDHCHFMDDVERIHEMSRTIVMPPELAWMAREIRPIAELCSGEQAHLFVRGLTLCHMDAVLMQKEEARDFLAGDIEAELAQRGVDAWVHPTTEGRSEPASRAGHSS